MRPESEIVMRPRIALMRAEDDAERSALALEAAGFDAVLAPVFTLRALTSAPPQGPFDAVVVTSARAVEFAGPAALAEASGAPLYGVGERARAEAAMRGLAFAAEPAPDVAALAADLFARLSPGAHVLYLAGRDRKSELEAALMAAGATVSAMDVYEAEARASWSRLEIERLRGCDGALHYSRRSAALALKLAGAAGLHPLWRELAHVVISQDAAGPLRDFGARRIVVASAPRERDMIEALPGALAR